MAADRAIAVHEAGHAVVGRALCLTCGSAQLPGHRQFSGLPPKANLPHRGLMERRDAAARFAWKLRPPLSAWQLAEKRSPLLEISTFRHSIAPRIRIVAAGWPAIVVGSNSDGSCRRAIICTSMYSPVNASNASRRQRPSYSGIRCVERNGHRICRRPMRRVRNRCEQRGTKGDTKHC
jgi:hypothetical protein